MTETQGFGRRLVLDNSAWTRVVSGQLDDEGLARWEAAVMADEIIVCEAFRLEALYSARSARDYRELAEELDGFDQAPVAGVFGRALDLQRQLAEDRRVSHRVKIVDLLVAAAAELAGAALLHYDHDFDTIVAHTDLSASAVWIAPRGSL